MGVRATRVVLASGLTVAALALGPAVITAGPARSPVSSPKAPHVPSRPETTVWGEFAIDRPPVLTVRSGAVVAVDTLSHQGATQDEEPLTYLGKMGVRREEILQDVLDFWKSRSSRPREGRAGHILTGPIYVEGAEAGDTLEIQILANRLRVPYGINSGNGVLGAAYPGTRTTDAVPDAGRKLIRTGTLGGKLVAFVTPNIVVPVRPFMGIMAVAPVTPTLEMRGIRSSTT